MDFVSLAQQCAPAVEPSLIRALVKTESAFNPLAIGPDAGERPIPQPSTVEEAVATAKALKAGGHKFSVGLAQIHVSNVETMGLTWAQAFEPCANLRASERIFTDFYRKAVAYGYRDITAVWAALRGYNSGDINSTASTRYANAILQAATNSKTGVSMPASASVASGATTASQDQSPEVFDKPGAQEGGF